MKKILLSLCGLACGVFAHAGQPDACIINVTSRLETITNTYHPKFVANKEEYLAGDGALWFARKDLESARFTYSGGKEGYHSGGRQCELGESQSDPRYVALKPMLEAAEKLVIEMETAKGVSFVGVGDGYSVLFKDTETGKEYSASESNHL
jgi:hypothetical protein